MKIKQLLEAQASTIHLSSLPEVYRNLPKLGQGLTSIVLDKGDGSVFMLTRDAIKQEWLTRSWGLEIGDVVDELLNVRHKKMEIRNMPVYVIELPKLFKLDLNNQRKVRAEIKKWEEVYAKTRMGPKPNPYLEQLQKDAMQKFIQTYPNSMLVPVFDFMSNYDGVNLDLAIRNTLQDKDGNIIFIDPLVSKDLIKTMYGWN